MTWEYLASTAGAIAVTVLVTNAIRQAFGFSAAWVALAVAAATQVAVWWFVSGGTADAFGLAVFNTFVVYAGATGGNGIVNRILSNNTARAATGASFWRVW